MQQIFERGVSYFAKDGFRVIDLEILQEVLATGNHENNFYSAALKCSKLAQADPPLAPAAMSVKLEASTVTNDSDKSLLKEKYEETFSLSMGKAKIIQHQVMGWVAKEEWDAFIYEVLPLCASLEELSLSLNPNLEVDIVELVAKLPPTLKTLLLNSTGCFGDAGKADWARLPELETVELYDTDVTGTSKDLKFSGCNARHVRSRGEAQRAYEFQGAVSGRFDC